MAVPPLHSQKWWRSWKEFQSQIELRRLTRAKWWIKDKFIIVENWYKVTSSVSVTRWVDREAAQSQDNNGWSGFEPRIKARLPLKCMKSFNLFSFNLSLHVVSRKFSIFFSSRLVWVGNQQKIEIPCMMECLSKRIFTRLLLLNAARRLFNLFLQAKQFSTNQQNLKHRMDLHVSPKEETINTTISLPTLPIMYL